METAILCGVILGIYWDKGYIWGLYKREYYKDPLPGFWVVGFRVNGFGLEALGSRAEGVGL